LPAPQIYPFVPKTPDALNVEVQRLDPSHVLHRMGLHGHLFYELLYIEQGSGWHRVGTTVYPASAGGLFVIAPGELHDCTDLGSAEGWVVLFTPEAVEDIATGSEGGRWNQPSRHPLFGPFRNTVRGGECHVEVPDETRVRWSSRLQEMAHEIDARSQGYQYAILGLLRLMLVEVGRLSPYLTSDKACGVSPSFDPMLDEVLTFIDDNFHRPISLVDIARRIDRSPAHLTTVLRKRTGLTAGDWIARRRMTEARRLLVQTDLSVEQIIGHVGYSETVSFARTFKRHYGVPPGEWRRLHRTG